MHEQFRTTLMTKGCLLNPNIRQPLKTARLIEAYLYMHEGFKAQCCVHKRFSSQTTWKHMMLWADNPRREKSIV